MAVFTAIATAIFQAGTFLAAATAFVLKTIASIGLSLALNALAGNCGGQQPGFAVQGKLAAGGDVPRAFLIGYSASAGSLVYAGEWGQLDETPNAYHTEVIALSDMPVKALTEVWVNAEKCTVLWSDPETPQGWPVEEYRKDGKDHLWIRFYDGTQTTADPFLTSKFATHIRPWGASRVGRGVAYVIATALVHDEMWTGFPAYRFATSGMRLYDPSRDSSVGGSGPQRWGDRSSWGGDGDGLPAVQLYNLLRGIAFDGTWLYGLQGVSAARLPAADWIVQIEKCRAITLVEGVPEPTYRAGGQISVDRQLSVAVSALLTACQGRLAEIGGTYKLHCGAPDAAVYAFEDGDILSTEEQSFTPFFGLSETVNGITGRYPNPAEAWAAKVAPPIYRPDFEAVDGGRRLLANVDFDLVPYAAQVQRLMHSALEEARRARRHTFVLPPSAFELEPGDVVSWTSERNFYGAKLFRVDGLVDKTNLDMLVDLTEVDPADYDPPPSGYRPVVSGPTGPVRPPPQPIYDWDAWGVVVGGDQGRERPGIRLVWGTDGLYDVSGVQFEVRRLLATELTYEGSTDRYDLGRIDITANITSSTAYQVRGKLRPGSARPTSWSGWINVLTPHAREIGRDDVVYDMLQADFRRAMEEVNRQRDELRARVEELAQGQTEILEVINEQGTLQLDRLVSVKGNVSAKIVEMREVFTDPEAGFAKASDLTTLTAQVNDPATGLPRTRADFTTFRNVQTDLNNATSQSLTDMSVALTTQDGRITNNANSIASVTLGLSETNGIVTGHGSSINQLTVNVDRLRASGLLQFEASASPPAGAISGVRMLVQASDNGVFSEAGFEAYAAAGPGGTRTAFTVLRGNKIYRAPPGGTPVLMVDGEGRFIRNGIASGTASQMRLLRRPLGSPEVDIGVGACAVNSTNGWAEMAIGTPLQVYANPEGMADLGANMAPVTAIVRLRTKTNRETNAYGPGALDSNPQVYVDWRVIARSGGTEIEITPPWEFNAFVGTDRIYTRWAANIPQIVDVGTTGVPAGLWQFLVQWRLRMTGYTGTAAINASDQQISISGNLVIDARFC